MHRFARVGAFVCAVALLGTACQKPPEPTAQREARLAAFDSLLSAIGGPQTKDLSRGQRWRLLASVGTGLPPESYRLEDLPEQGSRAVGLQQAYCLQCHGVSSPRMHTAAEWPILIRRMIMRAQTLHDRLGGPKAEGLVDNILLAGVGSAIVPSREDTDTLVAYFQRNALPAAQPGQIGSGPNAQLFAKYCGLCHEPPSPTAHPASDDEALVARMSAMMEMMAMTPPTEQEQTKIVAFLKAARQR
jgi:hypothetical protein